PRHGARRTAAQRPGSARWQARLAGYAAAATAAVQRPAQPARCATAGALALCPRTSAAAAEGRSTTGSRSVHSGSQPGHRPAPATAAYPPERPGPAQRQRPAPAQAGQPGIARWTTGPGQAATAPRAYRQPGTASLAKPRGRRPAELAESAGSAAWPHGVRCVAGPYAAKRTQ